MNAILPITSLLASVSFLLMGHGLMGTLLPLRGLAEGFSASELGVLGAFYFFGFGLGTILGPHAIGRVGHIRTFAAMAAVICIAVMAQSLLTVPVFWWVTRAVTGLCLSTLYVVIESWLNANSTNRNRGLIFSVYTVVNLGVMTVGQLLTATAAITDFVLFAVATMLFAASILPVSLSRTSAPAPAHTVRLRLRHLFGLSPVAVTGALAVGWANGAFWTLGPVFAQQETGQAGLVAIFMSVTVFAGAVGQLPFGWLSDRIDRRIVILLAGTGAMLAAIGHVLAARYWQVGIFPCAAVFGFFALPLYALCAAHLNDQVEEDGYVEAASGLLLLYALGAVIGPLIASALMARYGADALFLFTSAVHASLVVFAVGRICWKKPPLPAEKVAFIESLISAGTVANLEPRPEGEAGDHPPRQSV
ncbi:MFS transporter [Aurantimonas sp. A3-2-R12]|uniref:MFS transporter n=1 Tax=Aurantimonas sp. A3-2-R12 TaxID=3114362 RepID=UPI002E196830|nr:MFS transporter [Aurantimonas sp. A3-2-R12]